MRLEEEMRLIKGGLQELISEDELREKLKEARQENRPLRVKLGLDPSAPDIHLGHTVVLEKLRQFQELGHRVVLIIGDFTGRIGDPSGRSKTRPALGEEEVRKNAKTYQEQFSRILDPEQTELVFNSKWLSQLKFEEVLSLASRYTVARMLERDDFASRYRQNKPIGIHEFFYPLMQGYDSVAIEADIELGGTDQKFNLLVGRVLQREFGQSPQVVMMLPLLEGLDGNEKMSKSLDNYVGIDEKPAEIYGKLMSLADELLLSYFQLVTAITPGELEELKEKLERGELHPKEAKKDLARRVVSRYHGQEAAVKAEREFERVYEEGFLPEEMPVFKLQPGDLQEGKVWIVRLISRSGLVDSNSQARRLIKQGAVSLDGELINEIDLDLPVEDGMVLKIGKKRFARLSLD